MKLFLLSLLAPAAMAARLNSPRELGLFDNEGAAEACSTVFEVKHAFFHDVPTCETALLVQAVTNLRKNAEPACMHDTGTEMMLITGASTHSDAKNVLTDMCEDVKRSYVDANGCSRHPSTGVHSSSRIVTYDRDDSPTTEGWSWWECAERCANNAECEFWQVRTSGSECSLRKNKGTTFIPRDDMFEGERDLDCLNPAGNGHAAFLAVEPTIGDLFPITFHGCAVDAVIQALDEQCFCDSVTSLIAANNGLNNEKDVHDALDVACTQGWKDIIPATWDRISPHLTPETMQLYVDGGTKLNSGTGNLGDTPNPGYETDPITLEIASDVREYFEDAHIQDAPLESVGSLDSCDIPAIMCCFGRDRQSNDNNGNCDDGDGECDDEGPGDNSNLCFQNGNKEGNIHCHGFAWSKDENDVTAKLRFNNLFFVSLYDHFYTRGYVQNVLDAEKDFVDNVPMCGCMEDMPAVSRSDCTEVSVEFEFTIELVGSAFIATHEEQQRMGVHFEACSGPYLDPEEGTKTNDLSTFMNKLVYQGKMDPAVREYVFLNHLVGSEDPDNRNNEEACDAYVERTQAAQPGSF